MTMFAMLLTETCIVEQLVGKPMGASTQLMHAGGGLPVQRLILPVTSQLAIRPNIMQNQTIAQIRPAVPGMTTATQLPVGGTALNLQGLQGFALLPAQYVAQVSSISRACKGSLCCPLSMSLRWVRVLLASNRQFNHFSTAALLCYDHWIQHSQRLCKKIDCVSPNQDFSNTTSNK